MKFKIFSDKNPDKYGGYSYSKTFNGDLVKDYNKGLASNKNVQAGVFYGHGGWGLMGDRAGRENQIVDGWVTNLEEDGDYVVANIANVSERLAADILNSRVKHCSVELRIDADDEKNLLSNPTLTGVAMLGQDEPHVRGTELVSFSKDKSSARFCFSTDSMGVISSVGKSEPKSVQQAATESVKSTMKIPFGDHEVPVSKSKLEAKPEPKPPGIEATSTGFEGLQGLDVVTAGEVNEQLRLRALEQELLSMKLEKEIEKFMNAGKLLPAQRQLVTDLASSLDEAQRTLLFHFFETIPVKVTLGNAKIEGVNGVDPKGVVGEDAEIKKLQKEQSLSYAEAYNMYMASIGFGG